MNSPLPDYRTQADAVNSKNLEVRGQAVRQEADAESRLAAQAAALPLQSKSARRPEPTTDRRPLEDFPP